MTAIKHNKGIDYYDISKKNFDRLEKKYYIRAQLLKCPFFLKILGIKFQ